MNQEIKEEPLGNEERPMELLDHDYCLLMPKLEGINNFLQPKSEILNHFLVPKLEKPEQFYSEQPAAKLEPVESLEVVKQELLEPKLEEPDYSEMDCSYECSGYTNKDWPKLEEPEMSDASSSTFPMNIRPKRKLPNYKCVVCNSLEPPDKIVHLNSKKRTLVLLVGLVCAGKTMEEIRRLSDRQTLTICKVHLSEAVDEIYKTLNIVNIHEIVSCSKENKQKLMNVVNLLCDGMNFDHFVVILLNFLKRVYRSSGVKNNMSSSSPAVLKKPQWTTIDYLKRSRCSICSSVEIENELTSILSRGRLLALMVGCVLGGKKTVEEAQFVILKTRIFTCGRHVSEAVKEIFKAVNIKKVNEMQSCSMENKEKLMNTVNSLSPSVSFLEFCSISKNFCLISKH